MEEAENGRSILLAEFTTNVRQRQRQYVFITEHYGGEKAYTVVRAYLDGEVLSTTQKDLDGPRGVMDTNEIGNLLSEHKAMVVDSINEEIKKGKTPTDYIEEAKEFLKAERFPEALAVLEEGLAQYRDNPSLMSYCGCFTAIVKKDFDRGISTCINALKNIKSLDAMGQKTLYPLFYLNLGRAYLAAGNKANAINVFRKGLAVDPDNPNINMEINKMGKRKKPPLPFLDRSNPLNKYLGKLFYRSKRKP